jgi:hypothetical protein
MSDGFALSICFVDVRRNCLFIESVTSLSNSSEESDAALREVPQDERRNDPNAMTKKNEKAGYRLDTAFFCLSCDVCSIIIYSAFGGCQEGRVHLMSSIFALPT